MKTGFKFPVAWSNQQELNSQFEKLNDHVERFEFGQMLPGAVGFISKCGKKLVMYGPEYAALKANGQIV